MKFRQSVEKNTMYVYQEFQMAGLYSFEMAESWMYAYQKNFKYLASI